MTWVTSALLVAGTASAEINTITDGGSGLAFGDLEGFVVDIDTAYNASGASTSGWDVDLVAGQQYRIDSISVWEASDSKDPVDSTPVYLSVFDSTFAGYTGDTSGSHLTYSDNAIVHTATPDTTKITYTFTDLIVTADDDGALSGSGLLYFLWDDDTLRNNWGGSGGVHPLQRIDANPATTDYGVAVHAFGAIQTNRVLEIEITMTAMIGPGTTAYISKPFRNRPPSDWSESLVPAYCLSVAV